MSLFKKLCMLGLVVSSFGFADVPPPDWDAELVFDDFDDKYGDPPHRTYTGALASYAKKKTYSSSGKEGWWYIIKSSNTDIKNAAGESLVNEKNIETAIDLIEKCMHVKFEISSNEDYCGIGANILGENEYVDLSKMTSLSLKVKGEGAIRVYFESKYINSKYSWGHLGYIIPLTDSWKTYDIKVKDFKPAPWSDPEKDSVRWDDCKKEIKAFMIEVSPPERMGDKENTELWIDDIIFKGMKYSDIITPASVKYIPTIEKRNNSFRVKNRNITYTIVKSEPVYFSLFDLKGCEITKINGKTETGTHTLTIAPKISRGRYIIKMNNSYVRDFTITK